MAALRLALVLLAACGRFGFEGGDGGGDRPDASFTGRHWVNRNDGTPGAIQSPRLAYDDARGTVVMYGGFRDGTSVAELWELRPNGWTLLCSSCSPGPRSVQGLGFDPIRNRLVLVGGSDGSASLSDTWEWDGLLWTQIATTMNPGMRDRLNLVFDRESQMITALGGVVGNTPNDDLYVYNGSAWVHILQPGGPGRACGYGQLIAYDEVRQRLFVYADNCEVTVTAYRDDLWILDNGVWSRVCDTCSGEARTAASIVYDRALDKVYLIGGYGGGGEIAGTWQFTGTSFQQISDDPPRRDSVGIAYDAARDVIVMYGGNGASCSGNCAETWELVPN